MVQNLIQIATFDVLPTDDIFKVTLEAPEVPMEDEKFDTVGFGSETMIVNLGMVFVILVFILVGIPVFLCLTRPCKHKSKWLTN